MPGGLNLVPAPTVVWKRIWSVPFSGTASYARSSAPCPEPSGIHTTQTSAEPSVVPLEVTTGALDPKPNATPAVATLDRVGRPCPSWPDE